MHESPLDADEEFQALRGTLFHAATEQLTGETAGCMGFLAMAVTGWSALNGLWRHAGPPFTRPAARMVTLWTSDCWLPNAGMNVHAHPAEVCVPFDTHKLSPDGSGSPIPLNEEMLAAHFLNVEEGGK